MQHPDTTGSNQVVLEIAVDKKEKQKVNSILLTGNEALTNAQGEVGYEEDQRERATGQPVPAKKFVEDLYTEDKKNIITKYHEKGYRDAEIVRDTVYKHDEKTVNIEIDIEEERSTTSAPLTGWATHNIPRRCSPNRST